MLETIKDYIENLEIRSLVISDDGTIVIFKKQFDPNTGIEKPEEVESTFRIEEIQKEITELQGKIDTLNSFINIPEVIAIVPKEITEALITK